LTLLALALFASAPPAQADTRLSQVVIPPGPNPILTKKMTPARPKIGEIAWITVTATNVGSANAENVVITDPIPDNIVLRVVNTTQGTIQVDNRIVTIYVGTLAPGQSVTMTNEIVVTREFAEDTPFTNCSGLTFKDGTARLACFPFGPSRDPVSVTTPPIFLPEAGSRNDPSLPIALFIFTTGLACLLLAQRLRHIPIR
jgi:uncharacterized repeat protein (TIGR01451 family)